MQALQFSFNAKFLIYFVLKENVTEEYCILASLIIRYLTFCLNLGIALFYYFTSIEFLPKWRNIKVAISVLTLQYNFLQFLRYFILKDNVVKKYNIPASLIIRFLTLSLKLGIALFDYFASIKFLPNWRILKVASKIKP